MSQIEISEAAANLPGLIQRARAGEDVALLHSGRIVARIVPIEEVPPIRGRRQSGRGNGLFKVPEDFDAPLRDEILDLFDGKA